MSNPDQSTDVSEKITEPLLHLPAGINWYFNEAFYLNVNYGLNYFANSFCSNDIVHQYNLGIGIQFGGGE